MGLKEAYREETVHGMLWLAGPSLSGTYTLQHIAGFARRTRTLAVSRANSLRSSLAAAVGVGSTALLGREARPPWPHS